MRRGPGFDSRGRGPSEEARGARTARGQNQLTRVDIFTDGACQGNPGPGGWAAILVSGQHRREVSGYASATTNNRMELQAALEGLRNLKQPCEVDLYTDSQYLKKGMESWLSKWKKNGWRTASKEPVKNADLWEALEAEASKHTMRWHWVKGHAGHVENERCDFLANEAIRRRGPAAG
jgi:ribonuclease HI